MPDKVVISHWVHREVSDYLQQQSCEVIGNDRLEPWPRSQLLELLGDADAFMAFMPDHVDATLLAHAPRLKVIGCALKGYDNFDVDACNRAGVWLSIVPDALTEPTAELSIALLLGVSRHVLAGDTYIRTGAFRGWRPHFYGCGLADSTVGIIGMGAVGQAIAMRLAGFRARLLYSDIEPLSEHTAKSLRVRKVGRRVLAEKSDYIVLAMPLNDGTLHTIDDGFLATVKAGAYLINPCRGSVVDEAAVARALRAGRLAGYAADVYEMEDWARVDRPRSIHPDLLANHAQTLLTPHLGSAVDAIRRDIARRAAENIVTGLRGQRPVDAVNTPQSQPTAIRSGAGA